MMLRRWWHFGRSTGKIHVDPARVFFGGILETEFMADLLDTGFEFLDVVYGVVSLSDDSGV